MIRRLLSGSVLAAILASSPQAQELPKSHGLSAFGDLKYSSEFKHFDYVNPNAPKGGTIRLAGIDSFDSLNPYILKGVSAGGVGLIHATLMERANDEPDALYGLVAETVSVAADKSAITFDLRPTARFSDGTPITAADVVFTFQTLVKKGHPQYRFIFADVDDVKALTKHRVKFTFKAANNRDLPLQIAGLPVLSKRYYEKVQFDKTTMTAPPGAGPYRVAKVEPGRSIVYERIKNYWADQLPVMRGRYNFDMVRFDYFRDRDIAFQAFFSKSYDFREEFTSRSWATQYDNKLPIKDGRIVRATLPDATPSGVQAFFFNMRRNKFKDRRVRAALDLAFDYEWTNRTLFYGLYDRTNSMFANSNLGAEKPPTADEIKLLEPLRSKVPDEVFSKVYQSPKTDGSGRNRSNLRKAARLLRQAGWKIVNNKLVDQTGKPLTVEFLLFESSFQRIISPYIRNLKRVGIDARIRIVDVANFQHRMQQYDFDVVVQRYVQTNTPGIEQKTYFSSKMADVPGSRNLAGIKNPAIDYLIDKVIAAKSRTDLVTAVHALDRVLMWNRYMVPQWYKGDHNIAYWNKFERPKIKPKFDLGMLDTWWYSAKKAAMIDAGKAPPKP
ncbi:MAG: ABC transporter substrate-binding protein [Alphaproteobacteria bacterium]|nr:ABC transporter substrate-binding protein [Alphaproteobacteria bacterium]